LTDHQTRLVVQQVLLALCQVLRVDVLREVLLIRTVLNHVLVVLVVARLLGVDVIDILVVARFHDILALDLRILLDL